MSSEHTKYLLDTNIFLWGWGEVAHLNKTVQKLLEEAPGGLYLSVASAWEITIKFTLGKLKLPLEPSKYVPSRMGRWGVEPLEITLAHALNVETLPRYHDDPFDRILLAQARVEEMVLITGDRIMGKYDVQTLWSNH